MDKLGYKHTGLHQIEISNGRVVVHKGYKLKTVRDAYCQGDSHYGKESEPIPSNTTVTIEYVWRNFYGAYCTVKHNGRNYDIKFRDLVYDP
ncbi:hypothetical protein Cycma_0076 [Cyclobacterium marinum DSM 745]|uniref:Uncharacterized protein n=1 Tax=Cyclobacterium marinum (strain ATCC 25205 / DSM 745 / LMG 13164 / NCIMB 1802) TaxID=880070 RepID=G0IZ82_CYCMS|nr:hypothetical protein Cycma_0076 [Cyclobacterium marinum DSM 745]